MEKIPLIETSAINDSIQIIVKDLNLYPVVTDTIVVWPNQNYSRLLWTSFSPDITLVSQQPDYQQDSLTLFFASPTADDVDKLWIDQDVFINDNYAINPWTIGVATFDGLDEIGYPHDWTVSGATGWADDLTSKPIDLSTYSVGDSVYMSFFYQAGGVSLTPESDDSLVLEFIFTFYLLHGNLWGNKWFYER